MNLLSGNGLQQTTNYRVVLPFYIYAAFAFFLGSLLLLIHSDIYDIKTHYFHPYTLTIVHTMALGWATMIIFGASHQLLPVLIEGKLDSNLLAYLTFGFTSIGIPFIAYAFYNWQVGFPMKIGAVLINLGVICYLVNIISSIYYSTKKDVHTWYIFAASIWLFSTTFFGLLLVFNFSYPLLPDNSLDYLTLHSHLGIIGWFLLLVIGVGSRLIPMFLISKYTNVKQLWIIFTLVNISLLSFIVLRILQFESVYYFISIFLSLLAIVFFVQYCLRAYKVRIRKSVDEQMKISLLSVLLMLAPLLVLLIVLLMIPVDKNYNMATLYGFCIFFGWLTAIILGMTFKTLPFIVWNKVYRRISHAGKTPVPKDLFKESIFNWMAITYIFGFIIFVLGLVFSISIILKIGAFSLFASSILYILNVIIILTHQSKVS
ncbi:MAG TPA: cytochrome C oxidase subunit I [Chitinophagaceae bacterium]|nr:cytochrome C oxidase subunit I [Chitinophagaceae bacterium]